MMDEGNVCRVCMINSDVFEYCNLMERQIFKNIKLCEAFKLITGLDISNDDDNYPKMICLRCEKQLQDAYHFRQLAISNSKHFAAIRSKNSNQPLPAPRILNISVIDTLTHLYPGAADEQWIEINNQSSETIDATLKSEDDERTYNAAEVYTVDVNGDDGNIEVKPREPMKRKQSSVTSSTNAQSVIAVKENGNNDYSDNDQDDSVDAISFLLNNKHRKQDEDSTREAYNRRKFQCTVCAKKFVGKSNMLDHLRYHANIRNFKCTYCEKAFVQKGSLVTHLRTHTAERPYVCPHCEKGFSQKSALTVHIRTHTQERKYVCNTCKKAFMTTGDLAKHKLIHEAVKRYSCEICGIRTAQKVNMKRHRLRVHGISDDKVFLNNDLSQTPAELENKFE